MEDYRSQIWVKAPFIALDMVHLSQEIATREIVPMKTRMDQAQFQHYCREQSFTAETRDLLARIRNSPPVRRVRGRVGNISGFFPSRKMGVAIQFESSLELRAIYLMEQDDSVLEFYDQPYTFKLKYLDKAGKKFQGHFYTPDFGV